MKTKFPGFDECMRLMRKHDPLLQEDGFHTLLPHAGEYVDELIEEFRRETDQGLRCWLLELLGEAKSPKTFDVLIEALQGDEESLWFWAVVGLHQLNTKEARKALWEARSYTKTTDADTNYFQAELARIYGQHESN